MAHLTGKERSEYVQNMFDKIARRYNLMNRLMTFGQDMKWRRFVIKQAQLPPHGSLLDLATGTGDIAFEALRTTPTATVIGADFSLGMMRVGQHLSYGGEVGWTGADALNLPYSDNSFDAVVSGYLVRNVIDIPRTLSEQKRVLKPGGRIVILDTSPPPDNILKPFILMHLKYGIPILGRLVGGKDAVDAYTYLPESTQAFKTPAELAELMRQAGYQNVAYRTFMFNTMAVHWGEKPT
ncbi:ubiquinone/menaquinone biosynthesis methyltransferase [Phototrophicus methaneseepsis]|uniref:Demethylmenaquinone methyltransferase n=1 Tax=Phototrophicus methaneseepsis TaxID=2710758 RepID=A0A7S8E7P7_9CHLR|nr:ubiquinone/menaquinone biosynthesis methyltransferase [Phototrophicus methaneseepsis]QPC81879.1 ubiquinone/menaquinone biosynthesis methyltransferase [Phototrophicus methaneseepsis]